MKAVVLLIALAASPAAACVIRGTVMDAESGKPVAGTKVYAKPQETKSKAATLTTTGEPGTFCFERLEPGQYKVAASHTGYLNALAGPLLKVEGVVELPAVSIQLQRAATIGGIILGTDGGPREGVTVKLDRKTWDHGWVPDEISWSETDDHGAFRFPQLAPGTYYVAVRPPEGDGVAYLDDRGQPIRQAEALTYYRTSLTFAQATPIRLEAGQQLTNLSLILEKVPQRSFSGRLSPSVKLEGSPKLQLNSDTAPGGLVPIRTDGSFSANALLPAKYRVRVVAGGAQFPDPVEVDLSNGDVDGFVVEPVPPIEVRISIRGAQAPVEIYARNMDDNTVRGKPCEPGGSIVLSLRPSLYRLEALRPSHMFVKSLIVGGQAKADDLLDLRKGSPGAVEAILSAGVATLEGKLEIPPTARPATLVVMDELRSRGDVVGYLQVVNQSGKFVPESLAPGKYRVFAIEGFDEDLWGSLELAAALREKSVAVEFGEGERKSLTLPVITAEEWAAALRKVGM